MVINQWLPAAHRGDAVGDSARRVRGLLRARGHDSDIYALTIDDDLRGEIRPFSEPAARRGDVTVLHFAIASPMSEVLASLPAGKVIQYHNITPAHFFAGYDAGLVALVTRGREELASLAGRVDLALGDSEYNRQELETLGFSETGVFPIAVDTARLTEASPRPALERVLRDGLTNILFVGRIVPNKKLEDHLRLAEHYKRYIDAFHRFIFVGREDACPRYYAMLRALMIEYKMTSERFWFVGPVPDEDLVVFYRTASAYVSLSEHEGFCVPLLEAMATDVPVLAYASTAVPETLGGAGIAFSPKDLEYAAEMLGLLVYDDKLRTSIQEGQRRRLTDFTDARFVAHLDRLVSHFS
ncbi:MAG: glycosyltransferase family 4 protein [Vicinamibacterales bacterium]|nr:glycosyltransferase family 4 protein [Vicinamibacterales bacterium]